MGFRDWGVTVTDEFIRILEKIEDGHLLSTKDIKKFENIPLEFLKQIECLSKIFHTLYREGLLDTKDVDGKPLHEIFREFDESKRIQVGGHILDKKFWDEQKERNPLDIKNGKWLKQKDLNKLSKKLHEKRLEKIKKEKLSKKELTKLLKEAENFSINCDNGTHNDYDISLYHELKEIVEKNSKFK